MNSNYKLGRRVPQNPPPVAKKPSIQERQRRYELRVAMEGRQAPFKPPPPAPPPPPPPIGYNDADRFYVASPLPSESSLELDQELEMFPQKLGSRAANEPQPSAWLNKKLNKMDRQQREPMRMPINAQTDTKDLTNDDENSRRRLVEQLGDLKAENRIKNRELKTNKYIENEMNRKLKTADDAYLLRHTVKDKDRLITNHEKIISELTADNAKLAEDLTERDRQVFELQSEVDNLDRVIVAKKALREAERLQAVSEDLDKTRDELANANFEIETAKNELKNMQSVVNRKDREIKNKNDQNEQLTKQLALAETKIAALENEKAVADNHSKAANREAKLLKDQKDKLVDFKERCHNLEEENSYMAEAIRTLETKILQLESIKHEKEVLDDLVQDFKLALKDKNQIAKDRRKYMTEAQQLKELLRDKTVDEEALQKELDKLKDVLNELEKENNFYRDLEVDFRRVKQKYEEVEKERFKNELVLAKLRPRVERLQNRCKEKDELIRRLANELRAGGDRLPRDLLQEADRNQNNAVNDYIDVDDYLDDGEPLSSHVRRSRDRRPHNNAQRSPIAAYEPVKGMRRMSPSPSRPYDQARAPSQPQDQFRYSQQQPEHHFPSKDAPQNEEIRRVQQQPNQAGPQRDNHGGSQQPRQEQTASRVPPSTTWEIPHHEAAPPRRNTGPREDNAVYEETIQPRRREDDESRNRQGGYDPMRLSNRDDLEHYAREEPVRQNPRQSGPMAPVNHQSYQGEERGTDRGQKPDLVRTNTYPVLEQPHPAGNSVDTQQQRQPQQSQRGQQQPDQNQQQYNRPEQGQQPQYHKPPQQHQQLDQQPQHQQPQHQQPQHQQPQHQQPQHQPPQHQQPEQQPQHQQQNQHQQPQQQHPEQSQQKQQQQPEQQQNLPNQQAEQLQQQQPQLKELNPPTNVRARMMTENDSLLVEWDAPTLDELDRSNGIVVAGYKVFVNGNEHQPVVSSRVTKSVIPRSALGTADVNALRISVQSYSYDGDTSDRANLSLAPQLPVTDNQQQQQPQGPTSPLTVEVDRPTEHQPNNPGEIQDRHNNPSPRDQRPGEQQPDDRFRTRNNSPEGAAARLGPPPQPFVRKALYNYQPSEHSPSAFPPFELELQKGDEVQTFGPVRPDGLYNAEVNGKRGLVPAQYLNLE